MKARETSISGLMLLEPQLWTDSRGLFFEAFKESEFEKLGLPTRFTQDNMSQSHKGVVRGLHFQAEPEAQGKLVRCVKGAIWDVVLDIRASSPTFGKFESFELNDKTHFSLYIPPGLAHGFQALSEDCIVWYKCTRNYSAAHDAGIHPFDPALNIPWPLPLGEVSDKDKSLPHFAEWKELSR